jgi:transcription elongation factor Elf1
MRASEYIADSNGARRTVAGNKLEYFFACPYCWQQISMVLDLSVSGQVYVEDCEVCCKAMEIEYKVEDERVVEFEARTL